MQKKSGTKHTGRKLSLQDMGACAFNAQVKETWRHTGAQCAGKLNPKLDFRTPCGTTETTKITVVFVSTAADLDAHPSIATRALYAEMNLARTRVAQRRFNHCIGSSCHEAYKM